MEERLFTFLGSVSHDHTWLILSHALLAFTIIFAIARSATSRMQLVPTGSQNLMEAYLGGVISMGTDSMGEANARRYLPLM